MLKKDILLTISYYGLNNYPLTFVEITKFLSGKERPRLLKIEQNLRELIAEDKVQTWRGFYFLPKQRKTVQQRIHNQKLAINKRLALKKILKKISFVPFVRDIFLSGSFNIDNSKRSSDFDFLVITTPARLWLCRFLLSTWVFLLGTKRQDGKTGDRVCLNCFLDEKQLTITMQSKPHDLHSAQEYGRILPLFQNSKIFNQFQQKNDWLKSFLPFYSWPREKNYYSIKRPKALSAIKIFLEKIIDILGGNFWERVAKKIQKRRIHSNSPRDQIYCSDRCLMLHPSSKAFEILKKLKRQ